MDNLTLYGTKCETCGKQTDSYSFVVDDVAKIDLNRIVREQFEAGNLITLLTDGKEPKGLLINNEFLKTFHPKDGQYVDGEELKPQWGWASLGVQYDGRSSFSLNQNADTCQLVTSRFRPMSTSDDIEKAKTELAAARAFTRKIPVVVHSL